jgi:putative transposase
MKKSKFSEAQIVSILKHAEDGMKVPDLCREHSISSATFYKWRSKYGGMQVSEAKSLRELESENLKLKQLLGEKDLQLLAMQEVLRKNL